jgi:ADP-heptose:LPS heptosyltransferase
LGRSSGGRPDSLSLRALVGRARSGGRTAAAGAFEALVRAASLRVPFPPSPPAEPRSIFVLRNNDVGDLLVITPLFEALRRRFPAARLAAGVGSWNLDVLRHNPHLSEVLPVNAPWFNKYQASHGALGRLGYLRSPEVAALAARRFDIGIDVLGSAWGSLLLLQARIPYRLGVRGYAGGHSAVQVALPFDPDLHVGRAALRFAEALGARELPVNRPQIFLTADETSSAETRWTEAGAPRGTRRRRVVIGPGGGVEARRWPADRFRELARRLPELGDVSTLVLGGPREEDLVRWVAAASQAAWSFPTAPGLREVFAMVATADLVVCNSSMLLHAAAAFARPTITVLGPAFPSARQHQAQWGYPGISRSLGCETAERQALATPEAVLEAVHEEILKL